MTRHKMEHLMIKFKHIASAAAALIIFTAGYASANPLVFQGQNAAIFPGANPSDTTLMMSSTPKPARSSTTSATSLSSSAYIVQTLEAQLSNKIYNDIFGSGASPNGSHVLPDGTIISWATVAGVVQITEKKPDGTVIQLY